MIGFAVHNLFRALTLAALLGLLVPAVARGQTDSAETATQPASPAGETDISEAPPAVATSPGGVPTAIAPSNPADATQPATDAPKPVTDATQPSVISPPATTAAPTLTGPIASTVPPEDLELVINFAGADWKLVLEWLADQAGLSLQVDRYPPGTVNYVDNSRTYRLGEAMDVINRLLLDRGFSLIRRGRQLILIDQESEVAASLISELAEWVTIDELDTRGNSDIVRCVFPLGSLSAETAKVEIGQLIGPAGRVIVLDSSKQVVVTETVSRLKAIRTLLANASMASSDVTEIVLKYRVADELLEIARPLIGLEAGANSSDKIRIATGLYGDRLYATGDAATRALLERIIERADTPLQMETSAGGNEQSLPRLETYTVSTVSPSTVIDVLQTLLAGVPDTRIAVDPQAGGIIVFARPETHVTIQQTIDKLEGRGSTFEIIQLRRLEPSQALATINKFFGSTDGTSKDAPTIDGDPATGRLWVRGTPEQIELVRNLIEKLEGADATGPLGDRVRVLPYSGRSAEETVEQLQSLWQAIGKKNKIRMVTPARGDSTSNSKSFPQRRIGGLIVPPGANEPFAPTENSDRQFETPASATEAEPLLDRLPSSRLLPDEARRIPSKRNDRSLDPMTLVSDTSSLGQPLNLAGLDFAGLDNADSEQDQPAAPITPDGSGDIIITMTPGGMIVASDDPLALSDFEQMMRTLTDQSALSSAEPTVFWLRYAKATEAADLVTKILGGDTGGDTGGGLAGSMLGELGGGMLGGLLGIGGGDSGSSATGSILTTTGSVSIVPDGRLNALIVQANAVDMQTIEMILEVVDREESPEDVRTTSKPQLIPVIYQSATDVANIVKAVYAERSGDQRGGGGGQPQVSPQDLINALRGGGGGRGGRGGGNEQATKPAPVLIAVDTRSNSLIVTAPPQDVEDIRELVEAIDAGGMQSEETVEIVSLKGTIKAEVVQQALDSILGTKAKITAATATSGATTPASSAAGDAASNDDIQRRIEFFRQMRERGGFGGSPGGAPGGAGPAGGGSTRGGGSTGGGRSGGDAGRGGSRR